MAKTLEIKSISQVAESAKQYIEDRRTGKEKSLKVKSEPINSTFMNGFDWGRIATIAGISGSGKSTILRQWIKEMIECNPEEEFDVLSFQFEMLGVDEVARDISSTVEKTIKEIYSAEGSLTAKDSADINKALDAIKKYPIHIVDTIGTVQNIIDTILYYISSNDLATRKRGIVISIDHSLLVKGDDEKATLDQLYHALVALKMYLASIGVKAMIFVLSQLNRNIESVERVTNPKLHYPNKNDLFGASSVYYSSDYVMVLHKPCLIEGLGNWYGPARKNNPAGLPVFNPKNDKQPMIYLHVIKERFGSTRILPMLDELSSARIVDYVK